MPFLKNVIASLSLVALTACPAPPDAGGDQSGGSIGQPGPGPGPGQQGPGAPGGLGEADQTNGQNRTPAQQREMTPTETAGLPSFESLVDGGAETVTVSGTVQGVANGRIDFQIANKAGEWTVPRIVQSADVKNGKFEVDVPVDYTVPVYIEVLNDENGNGADKDDPRIYYPEALSIGGEDISLELSAGAEPAWVKEIFSVLPDPEAGENIIKDGEPFNAQVLSPVNPAPDGIEQLPPGTGGPTFDEGPRAPEGEGAPPQGEGAPPQGEGPPPEAPY